MNDYVAASMWQLTHHHISRAISLPDVCDTTGRLQDAKRLMSKFAVQILVEFFGSIVMKAIASVRSFATLVVAHIGDNSVFGRIVPMAEKFVVTDKFRIVSGGQSGADVAGLDWALDNGIAHGGWCPKGRRSEDGPIDARYDLVETPNANYLQRTEWNVRDSDATVIFTLDNKLDGGSRRTADFGDKLGKPWIHIRAGVDPKYLARFLLFRNVLTLNVAGKRESAQPGIYAFARKVFEEALCPGTPHSAGGAEGS